MEAVIGTKGTERMGMSLLTLEGIVEAKALLPGTFAQKGELITLMRVLELFHEKRVNVYTDSK